MSTPLNGSVLKAFSILRLITPERPEISASTVASEFGMNTATAHRFLLTLEESGALVSYRRGYFSLGAGIQELGRLAEITNPLAIKLQPIVSDLARKLHESVMVCRLGRKGPTCIAVAPSDRPLTVNINVGTVLPIGVTAQGRLWLANMSEEDVKDWLEGAAEPTAPELEQIKAQDYARNSGENEPDIGALAVPVRGRNGEVALTLSTFGMLSRFDDEMVENALPILKAAAAQIHL
ncbi:IclR family transcriptional regulator [Roseibium sp. MMSF_3544]|uniref:IclR family transcriptional regulator n=1 Tax=unclassified Roseibium TaxID=2629323 RepID=UPI00273F8E29|nr:IclR family transcriptional regulator [Roseibium sp. MMSF_3544]